MRHKLKAIQGSTHSLNDKRFKMLFQVTFQCNFHEKNKRLINDPFIKEQIKQVIGYVRRSIFVMLNIQLTAKAFSNLEKVSKNEMEDPQSQERQS